MTEEEMSKLAKFLQALEKKRQSEETKFYSRYYALNGCILLLHLIVTHSSLVRVGHQAVLVRVEVK